MIYKVRQKFFSLGGAFTITDEQDRGVFTVQGEVFSLGRRLTLYDMSGNEVCLIKQRIFAFMPTYEIIVRGAVMAEVRHKFRFFRHDFRVEGPMGHHEIEGEPWGYDFRITREGACIATVSKKVFSWTDAYAVETAPGQNDAFLLSLCIIIDMACHEGKH